MNKLYGDGGSVESQNRHMLMNQAIEFKHHAEELIKAISKNKKIDAWVIAKAERASTDLSDITHYLEGRTKKFKSGGTTNGYYETMANGGEVEEGVDLFDDYDNIPHDVKRILEKYSEDFEDGSYEGMGNALRELNQIGYTFEYYVSGDAYDLRKIGQKGKSESNEFGYGGKMKKGGLTGDVHSLTDELLSQKIQIFLEKIKPIKYYYIDEESNSLIVGVDENYTQGAADKLYKEATSSMEFFDADSVDMEYFPKTKDTQYIIKLKKPVKYASGGMIEHGFKVGDKILSGKVIGTTIRVRNENYDEDARIDLETGKRTILQYDSKSKKWIEKEKKASGGIMAKGGSVKKEWIAIYVNEQNPNERKVISALGTTKEEAIRDARMSEGYYGIKKPFGLFELYVKEDSTPKMAKGGEIRYKVKGNNFSAQIENGREFKKYIERAFNNQKDSEQTYPMNFITEIAYTGKIVKNEGSNYLKDYSYKGTLTKFAFLDDADFVKALSYLDRPAIRKMEDGGKMAMGGKVTFQDKVDAISRRLEGKKVPPRLEKDYGKRYNKAESEMAARRIAGSMRKKGY